MDEVFEERAVRQMTPNALLGTHLPMCYIGLGPIILRESYSSFCIATALSRTALNCRIKAYFTVNLANGKSFGTLCPKPEEWSLDTEVQQRRYSHTGQDIDGK